MALLLPDIRDKISAPPLDTGMKLQHYTLPACFEQGLPRRRKALNLTTFFSAVKPKGAIFVSPRPNARVQPPWSWHQRLLLSCRLCRYRLFSWHEFPSPGSFAHVWALFSPARFFRRWLRMG
ncbi:hypothetical protein JW933_11090, partial [candidate division FCPU426 bacterium]|nr:hypothetical protein [candidate division FCPU426 bacterium]